MTKKGILTVVSGFSGAGKGTIMKALMEQYQERYALSISATTREPRAGEVDGREYFFCSKESFEAMIEKDELIEYANYVDHYYGTPKAYVEKMLEDGKDVILEIEIQGALKVRKKFPDTLLLFVSPPCADTLKSRLVGRGTEDIKTIEKRLTRATEESLGIENYDYFVINDDLKTCVEQVHSIIQNEKSRVSRNINLINQIREELKGFSEGE